MRCSNCGGEYRYRHGEGWTCDHCGHQVTSFGNDSELNDELSSTLDVANGLRMEDYDFDGALELCKQILAGHPDNEEANWCALLAENRIIYQQNGNGKYVATFLTPDTIPSIKQSGYYARLSEFRKKEADEIEKMRLIVLRESTKTPDYDVFISYKRHEGDRNERETPEAAWAEEVYQFLCKPYKGTKLRVFYDKESLDSSNAGWEPHIYSALRSSELLIVLGSSLRNINAPWVKNEWKRFLVYQQMGENKTIAVMGAGVKPEDLPDPAMREKQMLMIDNKQKRVLTKRLKRKLLKRVHEACSDSDVPSLLEMTTKYVQKKKFRKAKICCEKVLQLDPRCAEGYWGLLQCKLKAFDDYDIIKSKKPLERRDEFRSALICATGETLERYRNVQKAQITHNTAGQERTNYNIWRTWSKPKRIAKRVIALVCLLLVVGATGYGAWDYTHPLRYSISDSQATVERTGIFFNYLSPDDLVIDTYRNHPIVSIENGAFKGSRFQTVKLSHSVQNIGQEAFADNGNLSTVNCLGSNITIAKNAFRNCTSLQTVLIGGDNAGNVSIAQGAFENCIQIERVTLKGLTSLGANAFSGCAALQEVRIDSGRNMTIAPGAFDNTPSSLVVWIPTVEEDIYRSLKREYANVTFETYTRDRVEETEYFIDRIGEITIDSLPDLEKAEQLLGLLDASDQGHVKNVSDLRDAQTVYSAVSLIERIGPVTLQSGEKIREAEDAVLSLSNLQSRRVGNLEMLTNARAVYDTMTSIAGIGVVSVQSKSVIEYAEALYSELTDLQKQAIVNYADLQRARNDYDVCVTVDLIDQIGAVNQSSGPAITQAEASYERLPSALKTRVSNYGALQSAKQVYKVITAIELVKTVTKDSMANIVEAENLYAALTADRKEQVVNAELLTDARTVFAVVDLIESIGTVTLLSEPGIENAEIAYNGLTAGQKERVGNIGTLTSDRAVFDTMELIEAIGNVTAGSQSVISSALTAYNQLSTAEKKLVANYPELQVKDVDCKILSIGTVSSSSKSAIERAETAYGELPTGLQAQVLYFDQLREARLTYDVTIAVFQSGTVLLGKGADYSYREINSSNLHDVLTSVNRSEIDSITVTGLVSIASGAWENAFPNLKTVRYNIQSETTQSSFTVPTGKLTHKLVGSTLQSYTLQIRAGSGEEVHLALENVALSYGSLPISITGVTNTDLTFLGTCSVMATNAGGIAVRTNNLSITLGDGATVSIQGGSGSSSQAGGVGMETANLVISGNGTLTVQGGNGANADVACGNGTAGAKAIIVDNLTINMSASGKLTVKGGDGGAGMAGSAGVSYSNIAGGGKNGSKGGNGSNGGLGGKGGSAISAKTVIVQGLGVYEIKGGNGGDGGAGGAGGNGQQGGEVGLGVATGDSKNGGAGGIGGSGGSGGSGGDAIVVSSAFNTSSAIKMIGGTGGNGGAGGNGGKGGKGGRNTWWTSRGGNGGTGGNGGDGGNGGFGGQGCNVAVNKENVQVTVQNGRKGSGGSGGEGGIGGAGGSGASSQGKKGSAGQNGAQGS